MKLYIFSVIVLFTSTLLAISLAQDGESTKIFPSSSSSASSPSPPTTTSPQPTPPEPTSKVPQWSVKSANSTCILLRGSFTFAVTYSRPSGNTVSDQVDIPETASTSGSCGPFLNSLVLTWDQANLTFMFIKKPIYNAGVDTGTGTYSLTTIFGRLTVKNPNEPGSATNNNTTGNGGGASPSPPNEGGGRTFYIKVRQPGGFMTTSLHNSYSCQSYQSIAADAGGEVYLQMRDVQVEAFHDETSPPTQFSPSEPCTKDTVSSVLSIVGYVALAVLIAAGLGYLGWKKFGRAGYTEV